MKKTIKLLDLDCGHCAAKIETAVKKIDGVTNVSVNFMNQKMILEAPDDKFDAILTEAKALINPSPIYYWTGIQHMDLPGINFSGYLLSLCACYLHTA